MTPPKRKYWDDRAIKFGKTRFAKDSFYLKVAEIQRHFCPVCGESIHNGEPLHLHHKIPVHQGGNDSLNNLVWLHSPCHRIIHTNKSTNQKEKPSSITTDWEVTLGLSGKICNSHEPFARGLWGGDTPMLPDPPRITKTALFANLI